VLIVVLASLSLGVLAAFSHLGNPARAIFTLTNLTRSWLSREALAGLIFGGLVVGSLLVFWQGIPARGWVVGFVVLTIFSGMGLVLGIAHLYMLRTVPVWNHPGTPASFLVTSLVLGFSTFAVLYPLFDVRGLAPGAVSLVWLPFLPWILAILVSLQLLIMLISQIYLHTKGKAATESIRLMWSQFRTLLIIRWICAFVGAGFLLGQWGRMVIAQNLAYGLVVLGAMLIILSEFAGRWIFYGSYRREGI
jgi:anaerobic dimethyl sulfoxide reductase subunit C (anchor subunit)